jgi:hypothetical protein
LVAVHIAEGITMKEEKNEPNRPERPRFWDLDAVEPDDIYTLILGAGCVAFVIAMAMWGPR